MKNVLGLVMACSLEVNPQGQFCFWNDYQTKGYLMNFVNSY